MSIQVRTAPDEAFTPFYFALMRSRALLMQYAASEARAGNREAADALVRVVDERLSVEGVARMREPDEAPPDRRS